MQKHIFGYALAFPAMAIAISIAAHAQEQADWLGARQSEFAAWERANSNVEAQLPGLKAKTAALVSTYVPAKTGAKYADLIAQSAKLTPAQRQRVQAYFVKGRQWIELEDYASAKEYFDYGLALDPANVAANFFRGDIYRRDAERIPDQYLRAGYTADAALYFDRVITLGRGTPEAAKAAAALRLLPRVTEEPEVNRPFVTWKVAGAPKELWDAPYAPQMVIIPAGEYTMGSLTTENKIEATRADTENPRHRVRIAYPLAVGKYEVTKGEFAYFLADSRYDIKTTLCNNGTERNWNNQTYPQTDKHPVACMSYDNAMAYAEWLSAKTGHTYRLLSESEWEYAARGGTTTAYYWGNDVGKGHANCPGCGSQWDGKGTSPVGSFAPNPFGLYDMLGNVWEIVGDCWNYSYAGAPKDGSAWRAGNCNNSLERGGNFSQIASTSRAAYRGGRADLKERGLSIHGFRVARVL